MVEGYTDQLSYAPGETAKLHVSCSCPYFSPTGDPCKHLWATILMADARGLLQSAIAATVCNTLTARGWPAA